MGPHIIVMYFLSLTLAEIQSSLKKIGELWKPQAEKRRPEVQAKIYANVDPGNLKHPVI